MYVQQERDQIKKKEGSLKWEKCGQNRQKARTLTFYLALILNEMDGLLVEQDLRRFARISKKAE